MLRSNNQNNKIKRRGGGSRELSKSKQTFDKPQNKPTKQNTNKIMDSFDNEEYEDYSSNEGSLFIWGTFDNQH